MFTSGILAWRRIRWMKETTAEGVLTRNDFSYDEKGRLVYRRISRGKNVGEIWYGPDGESIRRRVNGTEVSPR